MSTSRKKRVQSQISNESSNPSIHWIAFFVASTTFIVFYPALQNEFVNWDDFKLLIHNTHYRGLGWTQLQWMFSTFYLGHYQPLSWVTFALDYLAWGMDPFGYHLTNLVLHVANAVLFYFLTLRLLTLALSTPSASAGLGLRAAAGFAALFFSIHPLRVESVAWATERRDVLSGLFFLLTILCYLQATAIADRTSFRWRWLSAAVIFYGLSLLSKASGVTLPIVLSVLDVYPLRRLGSNPRSWFSPLARQVWREKVPFLLLAVAAAVIAPVAQHEAGAMLTLERHGVVARVAQALFGMAFYLWKTILPINLSPLYEMPANLNPLDWPFVLSGVFVVTVSVGLFVISHRWPAGLASWVCYLVVLSPVLGVFQSGQQMVADRYSYLGCLAWATLLGGLQFSLWKWGLDRRRGGRKPFLLVTTAAAMIIIGLGVLTRRQVEVWHDTEKLWKHVLAVTDKSTFRSGFAHHLIANFLADRGNLDQAIDHYRQALQIKPNYLPTHLNLGVALARQGRINEAEESYVKALEIQPNYPDAHYNLGNLYRAQGQSMAAVGHYEKAIALNPDLVDAHNNLGNVLIAQGQLEEAVRHFREAIRINPAHAQAHFNLGNILGMQGNLSAAIRHFRLALEILEHQSETPSTLQSETHLNLGNALVGRGQLDEAAVHFEAAIKLKPDLVKAYHNLGRVMAAQGQLNMAVDLFRRALRLQPEFAEAHESMAMALSQLGKSDEAMRHKQEAVRILKSREGARK